MVGGVRPIVVARSGPEMPGPIFGPSPALSVVGLTCTDMPNKDGPKVLSLNQPSSLNQPRTQPQKERQIRRCFKGNSSLPLSVDSEYSLNTLCFTTTAAAQVTRHLSEDDLGCFNLAVGCYMLALRKKTTCYHSNLSIFLDLLTVMKYANPECDKTCKTLEMHLVILEVLFLHFGLLAYSK